MSSRRFQIAVLSLTALVAAALYYRYRLFFHDDAFISLRYVQNFLHGNGLVWNVGERVEGYSNFLLVIVVAALGKLGADLVLAARLVGVGSFVCLVWFVYMTARRWQHDAKDQPLWLIPVVVTATAAPIVIWSLGGLETTLFTLLVTVGAVLFSDAIDNESQSMVGVGIIFGLATLCRPDGLLFAVIACGFGLVSALTRTHKFDRRLIGLVAGVCALIVPHLLWRYWYYGSWVPNTWYIKGATAPGLTALGWGYVGEYAAAFPFVFPVTAIAMVAAAVSRTWDRQAGWLVCAIVAYLTFVVWIGGDHMPAFRLIVSVIPLCGLLVLRLVQTMPLFEGRTVARMAVVVVLALSALQMLVPAEKCRRAEVMDGAAFLGTLVGKYINANWPEGSLVALNTAGSTPYYAPKLRFIDMLGLNDTTIAHRNNVPLRTEMQKWPGHGKGDGRYVLSRRPDYIIAGPSSGDYIGDFPWFLTEYELEGSAEFARYYQPVKIVMSAGVPGYKQHTESSLGVLRFVYYQRRK